MGWFRLKGTATTTSFETLDLSGLQRRAPVLGGYAKGLYT